MAIVYVKKLILLSAYYIVASASTTENPDDIFHDYSSFIGHFEHLGIQEKFDYGADILEEFMKLPNPCHCRDCVKIISTVIQEIYLHPRTKVPKVKAEFYLWWFMRSLPQNTDLALDVVLQAQNIDIPVEGAATTMLHKAARMSPFYFHMLVDAGANLDLKDNFGQTALHITTACLYARKVSLLVRRKANLEIPDNRGRTALHIACIDDDMERWRLIQSKVESERGNFSKIFAKQRLAIVKMLLHHDAEASARDKWDMTPLHYAVQKRFKSVVEELVNNGADVNAKSLYNETPFDIALRMGSDDCFDILMSGDYNEDTYKTLMSMCDSELFKYKNLFTLRLENMRKNVGDKQ